MTNNAESDVRIVGKHAVLTDGTTWPLPDLDDDGLGWRLTYGVALSSAETARVASIISAYNYLLMETNAKRRTQVVRDLRVAVEQHYSPGLPTQPTDAPDASEAAHG